MIPMESATARIAPVKASEMDTRRINFGNGRSFCFLDSNIFREPTRAQAGSRQTCPDDAISVNHDDHFRANRIGPVQSRLVVAARWRNLILWQFKTNLHQRWPANGPRNR